MKDMEELILKDLSPLKKDLRNENIYKIIIKKPSLYTE